VKTTVLTTLILASRKVGGQVRGGLDLSTAALRCFEIANSVNYGTTADYLLGQHYRLEFHWNQNEADVRAQPIGGFSSVKLSRWKRSRSKQDALRLLRKMRVRLLF
jgi:hypothetical protein